ncbi:unnamed protein product [Cylicostephanus goldi]|uniref:MULE transposase domain-containing protein n=1 Tax=Cylicostephanus goldi TaxID=71465 RepID=A0A3P6S9B9_CYLGO|nr:unnamed protein product [Cylicostephanus goldi]
MLTHSCIPVEWEKDQAERLSYQCLHNVRRNPNASLLPSISYWSGVVNHIETLNWEDAEKQLTVLLHFCRKGYQSRRSAYSRAVKMTIPDVDMEHVPEQLRNLPDGSTFLKLQEPNMHIYISDEIVKRAMDNGLHALIGDGVHQLNPRNKRGSHVRVEKGQVYTIHGVCRGGIEVPIMFVIARRKREEDYIVIFENLKEALRRADPNAREHLQFRLIVDFEMATISAARRVFPQFSIQGCSWHLSQAWARKRNSLGLLQFLKGENRNRGIIRWWRTLKGLPFLPRNCFYLVNALRTPPVDEAHPAFRACSNFLTYLHETWLTGPFSSMWCKYMVHEERTTNAAENYHGRLRKILMKKHPPLASLLLVFRSFTSVAKAKLARMERYPREGRALRKRDRIRREKVDRAMNTFEELRAGPYLTTVQVGHYLRKMSKYTSDKAI